MEIFMFFVYLGIFILAIIMIVKFFEMAKTLKNIQHELFIANKRNKNILLALLMLGAAVANGQAVFEHTYQTVSGYTPAIEIEGSGTFYQVQQEGSINLFTENHVLYKSILVGDGTPYIVNIASKLVNGNGQIEVIFWTMENGVWVTKIVAEDGQLIQKFDGTSWVTQINRNFKLEVYNSNKLDIYSLPGTMPLAVDEPGTIELLKPYPNPSSGPIKLPYSLKPNQTGQMIITDLSGRIIRKYTVTGVFSELIVSPAELSPGQYVYTVTGGETRQSGKFIVN